MLQLRNAYEYPTTDALPDDDQACGDDCFVQDQLVTPGKKITSKERSEYINSFLYVR